MILTYIVINILFFIKFRKKELNGKIIHKILSLINVLMELFILIICLYQFHVLFIIFAPFIIVFITLFGYGINTDLSDEDKAGWVINRNLRLPTNIEAKYTEFIFFPGYYMVESWKKCNK
jgi:hypothetical protein